LGPRGKESTEVWITQSVEKERENSYRKMKRSLDEIHTQMQTHGNLMYFDQRCLSRSEENKCMQTRIVCTVHLI
jgi:hypothetical protein